jgi:hypothetical protein
MLYLSCVLVEDEKRVSMGNLRMVAAVDATVSVDFQSACTVAEPHQTSAVHQSEIVFNNNMNAHRQYHHHNYTKPGKDIDPLFAHCIHSQTPPWHQRSRPES